MDKFDIETPLLKIIEGIKDFNESAKNRMDSRQYNEAHVLKLRSWRKKLLDLSIDLEDLID